MTSTWQTIVKKARPCQAPKWRKLFKWTHFTTVSMREWIYTVIVYAQEVIWSMHFQSPKAKYDNRIGESPWRSWCHLICIITCGLCSYKAQLFNDDVTAIGVSYWRRREFPNYTRLHRGRMIDGPPRTETDHPTINHGWSVGQTRILHFPQHWLLQLALQQPPCWITQDIVVNRQQKLSNSSSHTQ